MPGPYRRKKHHTGDTHYKQIYRTKNRTKDLDEIREDLEHRAEELLYQKPDFDKPGEGQFYCIHCARYFIDGYTLDKHFKTKSHKKQLKQLTEDSYTIKDSEKAAGFGNFC